MRILLNVFSLGLLLVSSGHSAETHGSHHHPDHRHGAHGMLLFGTEGEYFLSHIPMFQLPHNEQLVIKVKLNHKGQALADDFSQTAFSLSPGQRFSLDNLALGKLKVFSADIFQGNFEAGGTKLMDSVEVQVQSVLVARSLPGTEAFPGQRFTYFLVQGATQAFLLNFITANHPWQSIVRLQAPNPTLGEGVWQAHSSQRIREKQCLPIQIVSNEQGSQGIWFRANAEKELWCLKGPDFFEPCD